MADLSGCERNSNRENPGHFIDAVLHLMAKVKIPSTLSALVSVDIKAIAKEALDEAYSDYLVPRYMN